jgi:ABC-type Zn2+ transport system substrate-binding protein/surface adhesin
LFPRVAGAATSIAAGAQHADAIVAGAASPSKYSIAPSEW